MAEYIERRRLFNALADYWKIPLDWDGGIAQPCEDALAFIENAPEEDVAPVRHARWDENGRCSNCGGHAPFWCMASTYYKSQWCQECGAKMDLED